MYIPSPNSKFEHGFAIVRLEIDWPRDKDIDQNIVSVKKIVGSMEEAEKEVARLNKINSSKGYHYHWEIARLDRIGQFETSTEEKRSTRPSSGDLEGGPDRAVSLFTGALHWLESNYGDFSFNLERDLVWTIQSHLWAKIREGGFDYGVYNDYPMLPGKRRALSADLVLRQADGQVVIAAEFKYEPDHQRNDLLGHKFPVVGWADPIRDIERIARFVEAGKAKFAYAIFIDEGGHFRHRQPPEGSTWRDWASRDPEGRPVSVLWTQVPSPASGDGTILHESSWIAEGF